MRARLPQRCPVPVLYLNWALYLGLAAFLATRGRLAALVVWLVLAPPLMYAYVRLFPRLSRWLGYGSVADVPGVPGVAAAAAGRGAAANAEANAEGSAEASAGGSAAGGVAPSPTRVTLYTGVGCPFCPIMEERLRSLQASMGFELDVVEVTSRPDLALRKRIGSVPVLEVGERRRAGCMTTPEIAALIAGAGTLPAAPVATLPA